MKIKTLRKAIAAIRAAHGGLIDCELALMGMEPTELKEIAKCCLRVQRAAHLLSKESKGRLGAYKAPRTGMQSDLNAWLDLQPAGRVFGVAEIMREIQITHRKISVQTAVGHSARRGLINLVRARSGSTPALYCKKTPRPAVNPGFFKT